MLFSSMIFLWVFFSLIIIVNYMFNIIRFKSESSRMIAKNSFLLFASLFFYAWGGIYYLLIMVSSILLNFAGGYIINRGVKSDRNRKIALVVIVILNLSMLFFFKYFNMLVVIIESIAEAGGFFSVLRSMVSMQGTGSLGLKSIVLPIGISFFTFQSMSYVIDVYNGKAKLQENILNFALYVSLFPQLIAGPIVKYSDVEIQLNSRKESLDLFISGQKRFCYGIGKKVLISNTLAEVADKIWASDISSLGSATAWLGIVCYTLQIYYDFSGYSDMAIGIGRMLGFTFKENFNYPYTSQSVQEFWRRWHISLSEWFKEYIYIPLGGNRRGNFRTYFNVFIVFLLTGIWHGANFTFIFWGLFYAFLQIIERLFLGKLLKKNPIKILNIVYTLLAVMIGWVYFRSDTIFIANEYVTQMFSFSGGKADVLSFLSMKVILAIVFGVLFAGFVQRPLVKYYDKIRGKLPVLTVDFLIQAVIFVLSIFMLVSGTYNPFIYFQF